MIVLTNVFASVSFGKDDFDNRKCQYGYLPVRACPASTAPYEHAVSVHLFWFKKPFPEFWNRLRRSDKSVSLTVSRVS
jgi:hypothetical protein